MTDLGAYYRWRDNQPVSGLGAYYRWRDNQPVSGLGGFGLGATSMQLSFAEEALVDLLQQRAEPLAVVTPWGSQTGDVSWDTIAQPEWDVVLFPLSDQVLKAAENATYGHPVGWIAVLTEKPVSLQAAYDAFVDRRYSFLSADAVYRQDDSAPTPKIYYLYWAELRDDPSDQEGGTQSLDSAARLLGGKLVFASQVPRTASARTHPLLPVQTVIAAQKTPTPVVSTAVPQVLAPAAAAPTSTRAPVPTAAKDMPTPVTPKVPGWLILLGLGGAGYVAWRIWGKK